MCSYNLPRNSPGAEQEEETLRPQGKVINFRNFQTYSYTITTSYL